MKTCVNCNSIIEELDTWFLKDIKDFSNRSLKIGKCTNCHQKNVQLTETRIFDKRVFVNRKAGQKAEKIAKNEKKRIIYTLREARSYHSTWSYGVNTEIKNKQGQVTQVNQFAYDYSTDKSRGKIKSIRV